MPDVEHLLTVRTDPAAAPAPLFVVCHRLTELSRIRPTEE